MVVDGNGNIKLWYLPGAINHIYAFYFISSEQSGEQYFVFRSEAKHEWVSFECTSSSRHQTNKEHCECFGQPVRGSGGREQRMQKIRMAIYAFYFVSSERSGEWYFVFQSEAKHKWAS
ncbi:hypothetical protein EDC04DRAFT_2607258 [Pisolithus marmoratus]|nr:hypothetical protein EDC04DRAFT_2607258 [Pisolithus marmoratus]